MPTKCTKSNLTFFSSPFYFPTHPFQHTPQNHTKPKSKETKLKSISQTQFTNFKDSNFFFFQNWTKKCWPWIYRSRGFRILLTVKFQLHNLNSNHWMLFKKSENPRFCDILRQYIQIYKPKKCVLWGKNGKTESLVNTHLEKVPVLKKFGIWGDYQPCRVTHLSKPVENMGEWKEFSNAQITFFLFFNK